MYTPQDPYSQQQSAQADPYSPQVPYNSQQPGAAPAYPQAPYPQAAPAYPQGPYPPQAPYPPQGFNPQGPYAAQQMYMKPGNPWAKRAMISGIISIALSLLTLFTLAGFAGLITGTFAIIRGIAGLRMAQRLPNNAGKGQAIAAIVMGAAALFLLVISFVLRGAAGA